MTAEYTTPTAAAPAMLGPADREAAGSGAYKWYMLGVLVVIYIMGTVDRAVLSVIAEPLKLQFHLSDKQLGVLTGMAYSLTYALAVLPMGWLIDRVDRPRCLRRCSISPRGSRNAVRWMPTRAR